MVTALMTWRRAIAADDEAIVAMCLALNRVDPGTRPVSRGQVLRTLEVLRAEPSRGHAVVAELNGQIVGYALLIAFWSNELGGELCVVDEIYVLEAFRRRGLVTELITALRDSDTLWSREAVAIGLEVSPSNAVARSLFQKLGFTGKNLSLHLPRATDR